MPQFDTFIFFNSLVFLIVTFSVTLYGNTTLFLPKLAGILKLRPKIIQKAIRKESIGLSNYIVGNQYN
jgi:hypothetical protein